MSNCLALWLQLVLNEMAASSTLAIAALSLLKLHYDSPGSLTALSSPVSSVCLGPCHRSSLQVPAKHKLLAETAL
jgi:hypothetical protein